ncbi:MAG: hypothetical protein HUU55_18695 [Myxococcales bacterium]|nr:hypothetical protein [Myxococcales bacterium]
MTRLLEGANAPKLSLLFCAAIYQMMLVALLARIRALPEELRGRPIAWLLKETDILRDDWLRAIWHLKEAMRFCPKPTDTMAAAIDLIINVFALSPRILGTPMLKTTPKPLPTQNT